MADSTHSAQRKPKRSVGAKLRRWFILLTACRFSLLGVVVLAALGPVALFIAPDIMENGLLLDSLGQTAVLTFAVLSTSALLILQMRVIWFNMPDRLGDWSIVGGSAAEAQADDGRGPRARDLQGYLDASNRRRVGWPRSVWAMWILLSAPLLLCSIIPSILENELHPVWASAAVLLGAVLCLLVLCLATILRFTRFRGAIPSRGVFPFEHVLRLEGMRKMDAAGALAELSAAEVTKFPADGWGVKAAKRGIIRGRGYSFQDEDGRERPVAGHWEILILTVLFILIFIVFGAHVMASSEHRLVPASACVVFYIAIAATLLGILGFWLDRYRISTVAVVLVGWLLLYMFSHNYIFEVDTAPPRGDAAIAEQGGDNALPPEEQGTDAPTMIEAIADREFPYGRNFGNKEDAEDNGRTMIIVTAPGGGIHAAAWTAEVLARLEDRYGDRFRDGLGAISAVSGGSVGTMIHVSRSYPSPIPVTETDEDGEPISTLDDIRRRAQESSLETAIYGATYHDFLPIGWLLRLGDRGEELEKHWSRHLRDGDERLRDWAELTKSHEMPIVFFHATDADSGRRIIFSPVVIDPPKNAPKNAPKSKSEFADVTKPVQFRALDDGAHDIPVSRAVRLSATFPYVTPLPELQHNDGPHVEQLSKCIRRVGDGGYADNEGLVTAVYCVNRLFEEYGGDDKTAEERPFDRILLIRIQPSPADDSSEDVPLYDLVEPWVSAVAGPLLTLSNVRVSSQYERGELEVDMAEQYSRSIRAMQVAADAKLEVAMRDAEPASMPDNSIAGGNPVEFATSPSGDGEIPKMAAPDLAPRPVVFSLEDTDYRQLAPKEQALVRATLQRSLERKGLDVSQSTPRNDASQQFIQFNVTPNDFRQMQQFAPPRDRGSDRPNDTAPPGGDPSTVGGDGMEEPKGSAPTEGPDGTFRDERDVPRSPEETPVVGKRFLAPIAFKAVTIPYDPSEPDKTPPDPPLNWKLSKRQQATYQTAWDNLVDRATPPENETNTLPENKVDKDNPLGEIEKWLGRP